MRAKDWLEYDTNYTSWEIKEDGVTSRLIHQVNKLPWPLWSRDMFMHQIKHVDDEKGIYMLLLTSKGVDNSKCPCDTANHVRAIVNVSAFVFEKTVDDPTKSKFTRILNVDPSGIIPTSVVNMQASQIYGCIAELNNKVFKQ